MKEGFVPHLVEDDAVVDSSNLKDKHTKDAFDPDGGISRILFIKVLKTPRILIKMHSS